MKPFLFLINFNIIGSYKNVSFKSIIKEYPNSRKKILNYKSIAYIVFGILFFILKKILKKNFNKIENNKIIIDGNKLDNLDFIIKYKLININNKDNKIIIYVNEFEEKDLINLKFLKPLDPRFVNLKKLEVNFDTKVNEKVQNIIIRHLKPYGISCNLNKNKEI